MSINGFGSINAGWQNWNCTAKGSINNFGLFKQSPFILGKSTPSTDYCTISEEGFKLSKEYLSAEKSALPSVTADCTIDFTDWSVEDIENIESDEEKFDNFADYLQWHAVKLGYTVEDLSDSDIRAEVYRVMSEETLGQLMEYLGSYAEELGYTSADLEDEGIRLAVFEVMVEDAILHLGEEEVPEEEEEEVLVKEEFEFKFNVVRNLDTDVKIAAHNAWNGAFQNVEADPNSVIGKIKEAMRFRSSDEEFVSRWDEILGRIEREESKIKDKEAQDALNDFYANPMAYL